MGCHRLLRDLSYHLSTSPSHLHARSLKTSEFFPLDPLYTALQTQDHMEGRDGPSPRTGLTLPFERPFLLVLNEVNALKGWTVGLTRCGWRRGVWRVERNQKRRERDSSRTEPRSGGNIARLVYLEQ